MEYRLQICLERIALEHIGLHIHTDINVAILASLIAGHGTENTEAHNAKVRLDIILQRQQSINLGLCHILLLDICWQIYK